MMMRVVIRGKIMNLRDVAWRCVQIYHTQPIFVNGQIKETVPLEHHKCVPASKSSFIPQLLVVQVSTARLPLTDIADTCTCRSEPTLGT